MNKKYMGFEYYQKMFKLESTHWWYTGKRKIILGVIDKFYKEKKSLKILDMGCGTGIMLTHLRKYGDVIGTDNSKIALSFCRKRGHKQLFEVLGHNFPFEKEAFDIVTCLGVLCTRGIEDDLQTLKEIHRVLKKGGRIVTSDPAYNFLRSGHDEFEDVRERYTKREIVKKFKDAGFKVEKVTYWNTFLFPVIFIIRMIENLFLGKAKHSSDIWSVSLLDNILVIVLEFEGYLLRNIINLPFGVSLLCIGKK